MATLIGMDESHIIMDYEYFLSAKENDKNISVLYFKANNNIPLFLKDGETKLKLGSVSYPIGSENSHFSFYNIGGISKGVCIFFLGDCIENNIEISDVTIKRLKDPNNGKSAKYPDDYEFFTTDLKKIKRENGSYGYYAFAPEYTFSEGINLEHPSMVGSRQCSKKNSDIIHDHESDIHYNINILSGEKNKLCVGVAPSSNWMDGQALTTIDTYISDEFYKFMQIKDSSNPKSLRELMIEGLTNQEYLINIAENTEDSDIRKAATERLAELKKE